MTTALSIIALLTIALCMVKVNKLKQQSERLDKAIEQLKATREKDNEKKQTEAR